jgi:hypothetical protein
MVTSIVEIIPGGNSVARHKQAGGGMALINHALGDFAEAIAVAHQCGKESAHSQQVGELPTLVSLTGAHRIPIVFDAVKRSHIRLLPDYAKASAAWGKLLMLTLPPQVPVSHTMAIEMLSVLYGTLSKRKKDDDETAMMACAELFNPIDNILGESTGLWQPISQHPLVLALAIKARIATSPFVAASELREEMVRVRNKLRLLCNQTEAWLDWMKAADRTLFEHDRPAWHTAYARIGSDVVEAMQRAAYGEEPDEDDDGNSIAPSPRWQALDDLVRTRKLAAEPTRSAACDAKPARRTRKPKREG